MAVAVNMRAISLSDSVLGAYKPGCSVCSEVWRVEGQEGKIIVSHSGDKRLNCSDTSHFLCSSSSYFTIITTCGGSISSIREWVDLAARLHTLFR
jgi:hypothetical protein